ncbi:MAG TPA: SCO family protein [Xanthobacteraceae bacterium]|nr:SCO family protein [Xanthobacteraceae bacterium]
MVARSRILAVFAAFLAGALTLFAAVWLTLPKGVTQPSSVGGPFQLTDQYGHAMSDQDLKGRPFLVFFGFTNCPDICPTSLFEMSEVLKRLGPDADKTAALFISVDPERDTPEKLKDYLSSFHSRIFGLTGTPAEIANVEKEYRVYAKKVPLKDGDYTMDHTAVVYLMDKDGHFVAPFNLKKSADDAAADLRRWL